MTKHTGVPSGGTSPPGSLRRPKRVRVWRRATVSGATLTVLLIATVLMLAHTAGHCTPGDMTPDCERDDVLAGYYLASGLGVLTAASRSPWS